MECDLCMDQFDFKLRRPKVLPCGHTFCLKCLLDMKLKLCPVDRKEYTVAAAELPDNFIVLQMSERKDVTRQKDMWCQDCCKVAEAQCMVDGHILCSLKSFVTQQMQCLKVHASVNTGTSGSAVEGSGTPRAEPGVKASVSAASRPTSGQAASSVAQESRGSAASGEASGITAPAPSRYRTAVQHRDVGPRSGEHNQNVVSPHHSKFPECAVYLNYNYDDYDLDEREDGGLDDDNIYNLDEPDDAGLDNDHIYDLELVDAGFDDDHIYDLEPVDAGLDDDHIYDLEPVDAGLDDDHIYDLEPVDAGLDDDHIYDLEPVDAGLDDDHIYDLEPVDAGLDDDHVYDLEPVDAGLDDDYIYNLDEPEDAGLDDDNMYIL